MQYEKLLISILNMYNGNWYEIQMMVVFLRLKKLFIIFKKYFKKNDNSKFDVLFDSILSLGTFIYKYVGLYNIIYNYF